MNRPQRAIIRQVGHVHDDHVVCGWTFDCSNGAPHVATTEAGVLVAGWTVAELELIALRHSGPEHQFTGSTGGTN